MYIQCFWNNNNFPPIGSFHMINITTINESFTYRIHWNETIKPCESPDDLCVICFIRRLTRTQRINRKGGNE